MQRQDPQQNDAKIDPEFAKAMQALRLDLIRDHSTHGKDDNVGGSDCKIGHSFYDKGKFTDTIEQYERLMNEAIALGEYAHR